DKSALRPDHDQVSVELPDQAALFVRHSWSGVPCYLAFFICVLDVLPDSRRGALESHAAGDSFDDYVRDGSSVHLHGPACGDDCPHLSRVSKQTHVSRSREDQHRRGRRVMNGAEAKRSRGEEEQRGRRAASFTSAPLPLCSSAPPLL